MEIIKTMPEMYDVDVQNEGVEKEQNDDKTKEIPNNYDDNSITKNYLTFLPTWKV